MTRAEEITCWFDLIHGDVEVHRGGERSHPEGLTTHDINTWTDNGCWLTSHGEVSCRYVADQTQSDQTVIPLRIIHTMLTVPDPFRSHDSVSVGGFYTFLNTRNQARLRSRPIVSHLIVILQSKESEAAKSLIQEVFLLCSCITKVTVVEGRPSAHTGFKHLNDSSRTV